jgi:DNA-binding CsgD family transcriptional regulator/PAS domain-containing protein
MLSKVVNGHDQADWEMSGRRLDLTRLNKVGARVGEVVVDPASWIGVMEDICAGVGAVGSALLQADVRTPDVPRTPGVDDVLNFYFKEGWHQRDLRARGIPLLLRGRKVFTDEDITTPEEMRRAPYYNDCIFRLGLHGFAGIGFYAQSSLWVVAIQRTTNEGPFERSDLHALAGLADHLTAAATLSAIVGKSALSAATDALGLIHQGALVLDRNGNVIRTNQAAEALFDDDIRVRDRRLYVRDKLAASMLGAIIELMAACTDLPPVEPITIRRRAKKPVIVRMLPVPDAARSPFLGARALVIFSSLARRPPLSSPLLTHLFGLSPAEARLASIIAGGIDLRTAAEDLGVKRDTARNQLKAIFAKTGAHRQSELVELLAKLQT